MGDGEGFPERYVSFRAGLLLGIEPAMFLRQFFNPVVLLQLWAINPPGDGMKNRIQIVVQLPALCVDDDESVGHSRFLPIHLGSLKRRGISELTFMCDYRVLLARQRLCKKEREICRKDVGAAEAYRKIRSGVPSRGEG